MATFFGTAGNDSLTGTNTSDQFYAGAGNDTITTGGGIDAVSAGDGNDVLNLVAGDSGQGEAGADTFKISAGSNPGLNNGSLTIYGDYAGLDQDVLDVSALVADGWTVQSNNITSTDGQGPGGAMGNLGYHGTMTLTKAGFTSIKITYNDIESFVTAPPVGPVDGLATGQVMGAGFTDAQGDQIDGADGVSDTILGNAGNDTIDAGAGNDTVDGGADDDNITGGAGNDSVTGGAGSDSLAGGSGNDLLDGGAGDDDFAVGSADTASGGSGDDQFVLDTTDPATDLNITVDGGTDATSGNADDAANGNTGDILDLSSATASVLVTLGSNPETGTVNGLDGDAASDITFTEIEKVLTGSGNDTISGSTSAGQSNVDTGAGNDSITTGAGADSILAGMGNDTVSSGTGNDTVDAGAGDDNLAGAAGNDSLVGGDGNDTLDGGADADTLQGGLGADSIVGGDGSDVITSGVTGLPDIGQLGVYSADPTPTDDLDTVYGGAGADTISTGDDRDLVFGGSDADSIDGGFDDDILLGDAGTDTIEGGEGADLIYGGADADSLSGGVGSDSLSGGEGDDILTGGTGADMFLADGTADTITDFDVSTGAGDADPLNNDNADLSQFYNATTLASWNAAHPGQTYNDPLDWLRADQADGILQSAGGLRIQNNGAAVAGTGLTTENTSVICFARGTRIMTIRGDVAIEDLTVDSLVLTVDNGYQPIRWIGSRRVDGSSKFAPIQFEPGVLGNEQTLTVSPQHRVQVNSTIAAKMFGIHDVLVAAKHLVGLHGVKQIPVAEVEYFHFLLDQHELVISEGAVTETLFTGPEALRAVEPAARKEILSIFPHLADLNHASLTVPVRPLVNGRMGRQLAARHMRNNKSLVA